MKFKIGDKVRLLPSAKDDGIDPEDIGEEAIVEVNKKYFSIYIRMLPPKNQGWWIHGDNIIPIIKTGQLLFPFMMP